MPKNIHILDLLGGQHRFVTVEVLAAMRLRLALTFFALLGMALMSADPPGLMDALPIHLVLLTWIISFAVYIPAMLGLVIGLTKMFESIDTFRVPTPLVGALALMPTICVTEGLASWMSGGAHVPDFLSRFLFFFVTVQAFETVFIRFALPLILQQMRGGTDASKDESASDTAEDTRHIMVAGSRLPVTRVHHIEAQEHYVRVQLEDGSEVYRARLSDIIAQTLPEDGCQPHRSWWVSSAADPQLLQDGHRYVLKLRDQTTIPVSRGRLAQVQSWMDGQETRPN